MTRHRKQSRKRSQNKIKNKSSSRKMRGGNLTQDQFNNRVNQVFEEFGLEDQVTQEILQSLYTYYQRSNNIDRVINQLTGSLAQNQHLENPMTLNDVVASLFMDETTIASDQSINLEDLLNNNSNNSHLNDTVFSNSELESVATNPLNDSGFSQISEIEQVENNEMDISGDDLNLSQGGKRKNNKRKTNKRKKNKSKKTRKYRKKSQKGGNYGFTTVEEFEPIGYIDSREKSEANIPNS
jgi:hypothetical protein